MRRSPIGWDDLGNEPRPSPGALVAMLIAMLVVLLVVAILGPIYFGVA